MQKLKYSIIFIYIISLSCSNVSKKDIEEDILWYQQPATSWMQEALPIGNGYMGAMVFGGIDEEHIQFNEESLWTGGKGEWEAYNGGNRENAHKYLPKIRQLLNDGKFDEAHQLANKELTGTIKGVGKNGTWEGYGAYQSFGDIFVTTQHLDSIKNYKRELNISKALAKVTYQDGEIKHERNYFASYPDRILVFHFKNDASLGTNYSIQQKTLHKNVSFYFQDNQLVMRGNLSNNNMGFESRMLIKTDGESISFSEGIINIKSAKTVTLYLTASTDYKNEYPNYTGRDFKTLNKNVITSLKTKPYQDILQAHQKDYQDLYGRVSLQLGKTKNNKTPTDKRLKQYANGAKDTSLEALFFQYGRYLTISSSRPGSMPANIQGKWNNATNPPWASDYHMNINIQMIYWPSEITNLSECHLPLIDYIDKLRAPGRKTAKDFFNANGWVVNTMNNPFGFTAPGWSFPWGYFPAGAAWLSRHAWEHYEFTQDYNFLKNKAYPIMKDAALFWQDYLTLNEDGFLVSSPSYSPEHGGISTGAYMDIQIAWDLFSNCIKALEVLETDNEFKNQLIETKSKLLPLKVGKWGQLQEWNEDRDDPNNKHRHVSHLFALHPGYQINKTETPELADVAKVSLKARGDDGTGWSIGWKINFWARLHDGNHAYKLLNRALQISEVNGVKMNDAGGVYSNLLSTHPPFQLDGNMGATSGVSEMLLQSHTNKLEILPALPDLWKDGKITGLKARGNITVDMEWHDGQLFHISLLAKKNTTIAVAYGSTLKNITLVSDKKIILDNHLKPIK